MSDSIFGDLDIASAADNPFEVPDNTYDCFLTDAVVRKSKDGTKKGLALTYRVASGDHEGKNISEWKTIPEPEDPANPSAEDKQAMSWLKQRMLSLGVPEARMNSVQPSDLVGTHVYVTVKNKDGYTNVRNVTLFEDETPGYIEEPGNPFAK